MTVYVDDMYKYRMGQYGRMKMSHMIADTHDELHLMADKIGLSRRWFQGDHYDISFGKRLLAVQSGAVEVSMTELSSMCRRHKVEGHCGDPDEARKWWGQYRQLQMKARCKA